MKTAMQELIDWLDVKIEILENEYSMSIASGIRAAKMEAENLLEKEKEQILNFYMWMRMNENTEKYLDYSDEDMFKEYLNQDK
jgi:hypothetical protein